MPIGECGPSAIPGASGSASTIWPVPVAQCPAKRSSRSTAPPGSARPTTVRGPGAVPGIRDAALSGIAITACGNGPAEARTPGRCSVRPSCAPETFAASNVATTCAPCAWPKIRSKGPETTSSRPSATTRAMLETRTTAPITVV
ncbi:hypothetical protein ACQ4WX_47060 [Streptomyces lasalocidi]